MSETTLKILRSALRQISAKIEKAAAENDLRAVDRLAEMQLSVEEDITKYGGA